MVDSPLVINKLVVIGIGLIGGSLALALKKNRACAEVIGIARSQTTAEKALELGVVDRVYRSVAEIAGELGEGDLIFVAVPTLTMRTVLKDLKKYVPSSVTITDGASVKGSVLADVNAIYGDAHENIVLGHPIAGAEKSGVTAAIADLYEAHRVIVTPMPNNTEAHIERVRATWRAAGAQVLDMDVEDHDVVLAATSHLPHVIAFSLVDTLANDSNNKNIFRYAAGGFRDFTRIASSDAIMWRDIVLANKAAVLDSIDMFTANMARLKEAISTENVDDITQVFKRAKVARDQFVTYFNQSVDDAAAGSEGKVVYRVAPGGAAQGVLRVPGDKSISHRAIMLGSLAEGVTQVTGFLEGEDTLATLESFRSLGVHIEGPDNGRVSIHGVGLHGLKKPEKPLCVGNSGTSMRLLCGILAGQNFESELTGDESLSKRPMSRVASPLQEMGATVYASEGGRPPVNIVGGAKLKGIDYTMPMASAQVKSCLLLAGLYAEGRTRVTEPAPTRDHTERMLRGFGYEVVRNGATAEVASGGKLTATNIDVPADISSAAFFMVAAAITPGSDITLQHVGVNPTRIGVINILREMGADLQLKNEREIGGEPVADIRVTYAPLIGIDIPQAQVPLAIDEFPVLFIAAACAEGVTRLTGAEELRVKETDRIQSMADGLSVLGIQCETTEDGIVIHGGQLQGGEVESCGDHRIAMAFTIAALRADAEIVVNNCANVATSFPNFTCLAKAVGIQLELSPA